MRRDHHVHLADRLTDMILVGGANVYPAEVEAALEQHPRVRSSAVIGLPDDDLGQSIHAIVEADGDDPCVDPGYMDRCMDALLEDKSLGLVTVQGLPLGLASNAIRASALRTVREHCLTEQNDTGFIYYFTRTGLCRHAALSPISEAHRHETARLTLDYAEDLEFFRALFDELLGKSPARDREPPTKLAG